jgi:dihydrofolate reductase
METENKAQNQGVTNGTKPGISMIVALAAGTRAIGLGNALLWNIPEDMAHFKRTTTGHAVIMGERTYASIGHALPNRVNIVLTRNKDFVAAPGVLVAGSIDEALALTREQEQEEIFVIGGGQVYAQFLPLADKLYVTEVTGDFEADTFFPEYKNDFTEATREVVVTDTHSIAFVTLTRNKS